jgi:membrane fusion protein, multidrug efflux system
MRFPVDHGDPILPAEQSSSSQRSSAADAKAFRRRLSFRRVLLGAGAAALLFCAVVYGRYWWVDGRFLVSTDDAYVNAHSVIISPEVSGYITAVPVDDNQPVRAGQVLARIDVRNYRTALAAAQATVAAERAAIDVLTQQIGEQKLVVAQAQAMVDAAQAALTFADQNYDRFQTLSHDGAAPLQSAQRSTSTIREDQAKLTRDTIAISTARKQIAILGAQLVEARAVLAQKQAAEHQAQLNLGYTKITAPINGTVGVRTVRVGQYVQAGTQLMVVVPLQAVYVTANFKETQLTNVKAGQPVSISVDAFPDTTVHGVVNSIAPASGEEFALLPPDNATGNFTKIVQRVPVKIAIDPHDPLLGQLRPGMSVEPVIDTRKGA